MKIQKFQLLTALVALGGDKNNIAPRGADAPITYPELLLLQAIHGGDDSVMDVVEIGAVERDPKEELSRLTVAYGSIAQSLFSAAMVAGVLPERSDAFPTAEEVSAGEAAKAEAMERKARKKAATQTPAPAPAPAPDVPTLANLEG